MLILRKLLLEMKYFKNDKVDISYNTIHDVGTNMT